MQFLMRATYIFICSQENVAAKGPRAMDTTMDFEETDVLQCNLEYLTSTLEVWKEDGGGVGWGWEGREGGGDIR